jgi:hypothetical protein
MIICNVIFAGFFGIFIGLVLVVGFFLIREKINKENK